MTRDKAVASGNAVTFRGRGLGLRLGTRLVVLVCPLCSQRNAQRGAERGICEWCAYVPSLRDAERVEET
ncbi:hypothetical protein [Methylobacterium sp. J-076]|uniref:hypothetical protein n=1 Tax=Methylobacterium sp. J-076 TaxID=2836655 RepID=UPI001FBAAAC8|nr:hypothetical protein [Methylobacterium sp. J-076]MCJ2011852.1 hypothetical protein [Methylobacterium sp. J-076]